MRAPEHFAAARVRAVRELSHDVRLLELVPAGGVEPYPLGSHVDLAIVLDELPDIRSYSLVGERATDGAYRIAVKRLPGGRGGSAWMHALRPGDEVRLSRPRSSFELAHGRPEYLLVAGGIGITPLYGMAQALTRAGADLRLLHAAREPADHVFADELRLLLGDRLVLHTSAGGRRLHLASEIDRLHPDGELYVCGPQSMRAAAHRVWQAADRPPARLRFETFATDGRFPSTKFTARVRDHDDREIAVPANRTLLAALRAAGVEVMSDCLRGECGLCTVTVVDRDAELDHRDVFLSADEQAEARHLCACVSRAVGGTVTIDTGYRVAP